MLSQTKSEGEATTLTEEERKAKKLARKQQWLEAKKARENDPEFKARKLRERVVAALAGENKALPFLHELRPELDYQVVPSEVAAKSPVFKISVDVDGTMFEGEGASKKKAKAAAAEKALEYVIAQLNLGDLTEEVEVARGKVAAASQTSESNSKSSAIVGRNPVSILTCLKPGITFECESPTQEQKHYRYKVSVTIDDVLFEGEGSTKKIAKAKAAEVALNKLYGLRFFTDSANTPWFVGDDSEWKSILKGGSALPEIKRSIAGTTTPEFKRTIAGTSPEFKRPIAGTTPDSYTATLPFQLPGNKNPVMFLHELYPQISFTFPDDNRPAVAEGEKPPPMPTSFMCTVRVEDFDFYGEGPSKKIARVNAAVAALTAIESAGILGQRMSEQKSNKVATPKWQPLKRAMFEQNGSGGQTGVNFGECVEGAGVQKKGKKGGEGQQIVRTPVMRMNELQFGLIYRDVAQTTDRDVNGQNVTRFTMAVDYKGKTYTGEGTSKKQAKNEAAEAALRDLGLWTLEDDNVKSVQAAIEKAKVINRPSPGRPGGGWRGRGGFSRGRGRGGGAKPWIPGGVLLANPGTPLLPMGYQGNNADGYEGDMAATGGNGSVFAGGYGARGDEYTQNDQNLGYSSFENLSIGGGGPAGGGYGNRAAGSYQPY